MRGSRILLIACLVIGCAPSTHAQTDSPAIAGGELPPTGYGTMNQDDMSVRLVVDDIEARFLPLDERVTRLLGPDAYASLHGLVLSKQGAIDSVSRASGISNPGLLIVTFFGLRQDARFDPQDIYISVRSQQYRPLGIVPFTANFGSRQLAARQQATAIYLFETEIPVYESFTIAYAGHPSDAWQNVLPKIERERGRIAVRARRQGGDSARRQ
jgi:hypothetical protein